MVLSKIDGSFLSISSFGNGFPSVIFELVKCVGYQIGSKPCSVMNEFQIKL